MEEITGSDKSILIPKIGIKLSFDRENITKLLRSNIACHMNKPLTEELIDTLTQQIIDSIVYSINKLDHEL